MKRYYLLFFFLIITSFVFAQPAKTIGECTITYTIKIANDTGDAIKTLYIKGKKTRSEVESPSFTQTIIYDNKTGEATILRELNGEKYLSTFNAAQWKEKNKMWEGLKVKLTNESKTILGYNCKKAVAATKTGRSFVMYYTTAFAPSASENPYQFKNIPGLILEYESETGEGKNIMFKATKINFSPVPAAKFEIPTSGYRILEPL
ncbi:GLPGLI family protein [Ilyomonas limi]|uniref:GLPGLI family protein n=1 Tax=Ilyomonas limi TaxID=2575867 RepID=A0A4V5UVC1_9BACT|nr:GLPGLI family protein [Ilyomonas limi]TKK67003.1 GLPGLI family protein [Ilyomonas limi]